jgi:ParB family chromosome partitioning protein
VSEKRRGLGRGLGALIPSGSDAHRPVDVFFPNDQGAAAALARGNSPVGTLARGGVAVDDEQFTTTPASGADGHVSRETVTVDVAGVVDDTRQAEGYDDPTALLPVPGARFAEIPIGSIRPNSRQPRTNFDEDALAELVGSIREVGVLQPVVVRPSANGADGGDGAGYELIMGERRWRAAQDAGLATIPAIIRETDDEDLLRDALLENLHRSELNPLEEAAAYRQLLDDFGCTHEELAARIHRSRPQISNTLRLLKLPPLVQRRVAAGVLSAGHARALLGLADGAAIERLAQRIVAEGMSVRATEEVVALGGDGATPTVKRRPRAGDRNAALDELATRLSDRFETRVKIALGKSKGRLTVEFASVQDLNRILETLSPGDPGLLKG